MVQVSAALFFEQFEENVMKKILGESLIVDTVQCVSVYIYFRVCEFKRE